MTPHPAPVGPLLDVHTLATLLVVGCVYVAVVAVASCVLPVLAAIVRRGR